MPQSKSRHVNKSLSISPHTLGPHVCVWPPPCRPPPWPFQWRRSRLCRCPRRRCPEWGGQRWTWGLRRKMWEMWTIQTSRVTVSLFSCKTLLDVLWFSCLFFFNSVSHVQHRFDGRVEQYRVTVSGRSPSSLWSDRPCSWRSQSLDPRSLPSAPCTAPHLRRGGGRGGRWESSAYSIVQKQYKSVPFQQQ